MAKNEVYTRQKLPLPLVQAGKASGDPLLIAGALTGVALTASDAANNLTGDVGPSVYSLSVKAINDAGNSAVAIGDRIYFVTGDTPVLSKKTSGVPFGIALETVTAGATATIKVLHVAELSAGPGQLEGNFVANLGDKSILGGIPLVIRIDVADATGNTDVTLKNKMRVIDAWAVKTAANGGAGDQVIVQNAANAITNAISLSAVDKTRVGAGTIDDAQHEIAAGGTLRIAATKATNVACIVYVSLIRVA